MNSVWLGFLATLLGSLFGGFFALSGTYLSNRLTLRRDKEQWERQQQAEREKLMREEEERARERLREVYENCINNLTQYMNVPYGYDPADDGQPISEEDRKKRIEEDARYERERAKYQAEVRRWLWELLINLPSPEKDSRAEYAVEDFFSGQRGQFDADDLLAFVLQSARNDPRLKIKVGRVGELPPSDSAKPKELHGV